MSNNKLDFVDGITNNIPDIPKILKRIGIFILVVLFVWITYLAFFKKEAETEWLEMELQQIRAEQQRQRELDEKHDKQFNEFQLRHDLKIKTLEEKTKKATKSYEDQKRELEAIQDFIK